MCDRLAQDANRCQKYANEYFKLTYGPGLLNEISGRHEKVQEDVAQLFADIEAFGRRMEKSVGYAIAYYQRADLESSAKVDSILPPSSFDEGQARMASPQPDVIQAQALEQNRPTEVLKDPPDYRAQNPYQPEWSDLVSPGNIARDATWGLTWVGAKLGICDRAYDPLDEMALPLTGDWAGVHACADALANLSEATRLMRVNVDWIALRVEAVWFGNAADACLVKLRGLSKALIAAEPALARLGKAYAGLVDGMKFLEEPIEGLIVDLLDLVFFAVAAYATIETGIGGVVFGTAAIYEITKIGKTANDILSNIDKLKTIVDAFNGEAGSVALGDDLPALPDVPSW